MSLFKKHLLLDPVAVIEDGIINVVRTVEDVRQVGRAVVGDVLQTAASVVGLSAVSQASDVPHVKPGFTVSGTSNASMADIMKLSYKEVYAFYKYVAHDEGVSPWRQYASTDQLLTGLNARTFVNDTTREIDIAFEGSHGFTKLLGENVLDAQLFKDLSAASSGFSKFISEEDYDHLYAKWHLVLGKDGVSDLQMMANKIPDQYYAAYSWFNQVMNTIQGDSSLNGYNIVVSGHSLAGAMAQLVSAKYYLDTGLQVPTVAVDGPGMMTQLEQLTGKKLDAKEFSFIVNFCTEGDPVGAFSGENHVGVTVEMPYNLARGDQPGALPNYRVAMELYQAAMGIKDMRLDRHEVGQQISIFDGTDFSYPEKRVILSAGQKSYTSTSQQQELIAANDLGNEIHAGSNNTYLVGGKGNDVLIGGAGNDFISGGAGDDFLYGGGGSNILYGGDGNDYLIAANNNDELYGGKGNDTLVWAGGNNLLYGQSGNDKYVIGMMHDGALASGRVELKFDKENIENSHVSFNLAEMSAKDSKVVFMMSDLILPTDISIKQQADNSLYIQYADHSSITIDNWSAVNAAMGSNLTFAFGDKAVATVECGVANSAHLSLKS